MTSAFMIRYLLIRSLLLGNIPQRYAPVVTEIKRHTETDLYFAMARGYQNNGLDSSAMEMTKWFDTNYHYIVPEFSEDQEFKIFQIRFSRRPASVKYFG